MTQAAWDDAIPPGVRKLGCTRTLDAADQAQELATGVLKDKR